MYLSGVDSTENCWLKSQRKSTSSANEICSDLTTWEIGPVRRSCIAYHRVTTTSAWYSMEVTMMDKMWTPTLTSENLYLLRACSQEICS
jgi:hypothetical protein